MTFLEIVRHVHLDMEYTRIREYAWQRAKRERKKTEAAAATKKAKKIIMYWKECERRETEQLSTFANCANCESRRVPCRCVCTFVRAVQCYSRPVSNAIYTKLYAHEEESVAIIIIIIIDTFEVVCNGQGIGGAITQLPNGWCVGCEQLKYVVILSSLVGSHRIELITFRSLTVVAAVDLSVCVFIYIYICFIWCVPPPRESSVMARKWCAHCTHNCIVLSGLLTQRLQFHSMHRLGRSIGDDNNNDVLVFFSLHTSTSQIC